MAMKLLTLVSTHRSSIDYSRERRHLPWISSPIDYEALQAEENFDESSKLNGLEGTVEEEPRRPSLHRRHTKVPIFKTHHGASNMELFYDLFFVANLATFTLKHEIRDLASVGAYIGFISLLWFTWLQTTLFDVRFHSDSVMTRVFKAQSFGVMTGFAAIGRLFDTGDKHYNAVAFRTLSIILMISRLFLMFQYGTVLYFVKGFKKTFVPLALTMIVLLASAILFQVLYFAFPDKLGSKNAYVGFYVIIVAEAISVITISSIWRVLSFKHTHLVERNGLLTLIIIGEGIIGLTKAVTTMMYNSVTWSAADSGVLIAGVLLVYFLWILYFDQIDEDRFGTIRQQVWTLLHFPLHVAILCTVEGSTSFITWWALNETWNPISTDMMAVMGKYAVIGGNTTEFGLKLNETIDKMTITLTGKHSIATYDDFSPILTKMNDYDFSTQKGTNQLVLYVYDIWYTYLAKILEAYDFKASKEAKSTKAKDDEVEEVLWVYYNTIFYYFFVGAGAFLVISGVLYWIGRRHKSRGEMTAIFVRFGLGIGLGLVTMLALNPTFAMNYIGSPWLIPTVVGTFFVVIVLDNLLTWHTNRTITHHSSLIQKDNY